MQSELLQEISFSLYERYILVEPIANLFWPVDSKYRVLDVGGHTPAFWSGFSSLAGALIPDANVTIADLQPTAELKNYVQARGFALPFKDGTFDLVCSLDTLEHIPEEKRTAFWMEILRVTRDGLYLAFPYDSATNRWAESLIVEYTNVVLNLPIPALQEHRQYGLPNRDSVAKILADAPHPWIGFVNGNTDVWLLMMLTYHTLRMAGTDFINELNRRFNQVYAAQDWSEPCYRAGYLLSKTRSVADLEKVHSPFVSIDQRADLQSVLSFCQLFLTIAQNARVTADKDRHIHNIECELSRVADNPRARETTGLTGQLELIRGSIEQLSRQLEARIPQLALGLSACEQAAWDKRAPLDNHISQIDGQLGLIREQIDSMQRQLQLTARLDGPMRGLEIGPVTNKRGIQLICESRIWKTISRAGKFLLRITGRSAGAGTPSVQQHGSTTATPLNQDARKNSPR